MTCDMSCSDVVCGEIRLCTHSGSADPLAQHKRPTSEGNNLVIRYNHLHHTDTAVDVIVHFHDSTHLTNEQALQAKLDASGLNLNQRFKNRPTIALLPLGYFAGADCKTDSNALYSAVCHESHCTRLTVTYFIVVTFACDHFDGLLVCLQHAISLNSSSPR